MQINVSAIASVRDNIQQFLKTSPVFTPFKYETPRMDAYQ